MHSADKIFQGALKAVRSAKLDSTPMIVNTTCRDLPRAIAGKAKAFHYECMANEIRDLINDKEKLLSVVSDMNMLVWYTREM